MRQVIIIFHTHTMHNIQSFEELAKILGIDSVILKNILYDTPKNEKYYSFHIPKKSGGLREIVAPNPSLKEVQRKLSEYLYKYYYQPTKASHGFTKNKNIVTNAIKHANKRIIFNIDIKDFFPSINFFRIRGLFKNKPFYYNHNISTILANICTYNNILPQGAPTSPVISNLICFNLDKQLIHEAKVNFCYYTRYADDITFSSTKYKLPVNLINNIKQIIEDNGFQINKNKERTEYYWRRQEVTGLTVNVKPNIKRSYVRLIRAILCSWENKGLISASHQYSDELPGYFIKSIKGKIEFIGMVKGKDDTVYLQLKEKYLKLFNNLLKD